MAKFSRVDVLNEVLRIGFIPVFYHADLEVAKKIIFACIEGGARVVEFTNRGDNAYRVFSDLIIHMTKVEPAIILGAGSVLDPSTGALYISSGANFIVGSVLNRDLAKVCNRRKVPYFPGCGSASEISEAEELGVEIVKVFPGDSVGGAKFVKSILGPTPWTRIMPTGGVQTTQESITEWFKAGIAAAGIGSSLIKKEWVDTGNYDAITELTSKVICWIRQVRGENLFLGVEHTGLYPQKQGDGKELSQWYQNTFGFTLAEGNSSIFVGDTNQGCLEIMKETSDERCHIAIRVSDFEAAVEELKTKGFEMEDPKIKAGAKAIFLKTPDPAGNRVHLIWRK